jgi:hypothetical protein
MFAHDRASDRRRRRARARDRPAAPLADYERNDASAETGRRIMTTRRDRLNLPLRKFVELPGVARYMSDPLYRAVIEAKAADRAAAIERARAHHGEQAWHKFVADMHYALGMIAP